MKNYPVILKNYLNVLPSEFILNQEYKEYIKIMELQKITE